MIIRLLISNVSCEEEQQDLISALVSQFDVKVELEDVYPEDDDSDQPESDYYENDDNLEMGYDPYMGCYSDDC